MNGIPVKQSPVIYASAKSAYTRIRLINKSGFAIYHFWIPGVQMSVIEVDGVPVHEKPVSALRINVGQRYSILIRTPADISKKYPVMIVSPAFLASLLTRVENFNR